MPSSQGEFATCLTMSINRGELRALELRRSSTRKFDGEFDQGTQSYVGAARVRYMLVICNGSMSAVGKWNWGSYRAFPLGPDIRIPPRPPCYPDKLGRSPTPVCARFRLCAAIPPGVPTSGTVSRWLPIQATTLRA